MIRILTLLALTVSSTSIAFSQDRKLEAAVRNGQALQTQINVAPNVTAQAVLIPRVDARRIFGKEIANNYAVIEVNIGNKSADAALIIHGVFIDYTRWALSGTSVLPPGVHGRVSTPWQASTIPNQVASEEYRVVRGQLLDAQLWTNRNWTMRILTFAGNLASAYAFSIHEDGIVRGLNAFSGTVVPGMKEVWPDGTIEQLNRVSDFGFQTNKVIPKQGAEVIVCFFPIDRFLTPGFKKLFLRSPALFFAPLQMLVDHKLEKEAAALLQNIDPSFSLTVMRKSLPCYLRVVDDLRSRPDTSTASFESGAIRNSDQVCRAEFGLEESKDAKGVVVVDEDGRPVLTVKDQTKFQSFLALDFLSQMSLNSVSVTIDGAMTVDTVNIPGKIDAIKFDRIANCGDDSEACFWNDLELGEGVRTGVLPGSYLTGGELVIAEANELGITEVKTLSENASDQRLRFSFKLTRPVPPETSIHFTIIKPQAGSATSTRTVDGLPREYPVRYTLGPPMITRVQQNGRKLTITGSGFYNMPPDFPIVVRLKDPNGREVDVDTDSIKSSEIKLTLPDDLTPGGCWEVNVYLREVRSTLPRNQRTCINVASVPAP